MSGITLVYRLSTPIIRYISDIDEKTFNARPQTTVLKRLSSQTRSTKNIHPRQATAAQSKPVLFRQSKKKPASTAKRFEIHLKNGDIITARQWWEQSDMIMYTTQHGTMGIEKSMVENIVSR